MENNKRIEGSYRDPSGFVFLCNGLIHRQVNKVYAKQYDQLMNSGLYKALTEKHRLIPHSELNEDLTNSGHWYKTLLPEPVHFITYPYEWTGAQLRDAGLLTLQVMRTAMEYGMILKDATAYNIQFHSGKPLFIDTLSFEHYDSNRPWIAYRQFCESFLFPLLLERYTGISSHQWYRMYPEGIDVDTTARLLPGKSRWNAGVWLHVFLQRSVSRKPGNTRPKPAFSKQKMLNLLQHLESMLKASAQPSRNKTTWSHYYEETIMGGEYLKTKEGVFRRMIESIEAGTALDLGTNNGYFSHILAGTNRQVIATDFDHLCIYDLYAQTKKNKTRNILPLILDIAYPSPAIGFANTERPSFFQRTRVELVTALALIHHLAIGRNIPLPHLAEWFSQIAPELVIEFVGKEDEKVQLLLSNREDIFPSYTEAGFEKAFGEHYNMIQKVPVTGTSRVLYHLRKKN